jgi:hypothetical protein
MSAISRMGRLLQSCKQQLQAAGDPRATQLPIPPVFKHCTEVLGEAQQQQARDLYWKAVSSTDLQGPQHAGTVLGMYEQAAQLLRVAVTVANRDMLMLFSCSSILLCLTTWCRKG